MKRIPFDFIAARSLNRGIGVNNALPWNLPPDLEMFRKITSSGENGNSLIMGRKTFDSIGRALPGRLNIVISKNSKIQENEKLRQARSLDDALELSQMIKPKGKIFVIGGERIFEDSLDQCRYIYETLINKDVQCDTFFPQHNFPCKFISKTMKYNDIIYDYRTYLNEKVHERKP